MPVQGTRVETPHQIWQHLNTSTSSEERLKKNMEDAGFEIHEHTSRNGDCFFEAVISQLRRLGLPSTSATQLRADVVESMRNTLEIEGEDGPVSIEDFMTMGKEEYLRRMSCTEEWADHLAVLATARFLQHDILIITSSPESRLDNIICTVTGKQGFTGEPILVGHIWESHYISLRPKDTSLDKDQSATQPQDITSERADTKAVGSSEDVPEVSGQLLAKQELLSRTKSELVDCIKLSNLFWEALTKYGVISLDELYEIKTKTSAIEEVQVSEVINHLIAGTEEQYQAFLKTLLETGQEEIVTRVLEEELPDHSALHAAEADHAPSVQLQGDKAKVLKERGADLITQIVPSSLLMSLLSTHGAIPESDVGSIQNENESDARKVSRILEIIEKGTSEQYHRFVQSLIEANQVEVVSDILHEDATNYKDIDIKECTTGEVKLTVSHLSDCMFLQTTHITTGLKSLKVDVTSVPPKPRQGAKHVVHHLLETFHPLTMSINILRALSDMDIDSFFICPPGNSLYLCEWNRGGAQLYCQRKDDVETMEIAGTSRVAKIYPNGEGEMVIVADQLLDTRILQKKDIEQPEQCNLHIYVNRVLKLDTDMASTCEQTEEWQQTFTHLLETLHPPLITVSTTKSESVITEDRFCMHLEAHADDTFYLCGWNKAGTMLSLTRTSKLLKVEVPNKKRHVGMYRADDDYMVLVADQMSDYLALQKEHIQQSEQCVLEAYSNYTHKQDTKGLVAPGQYKHFQHTFNSLLETFHPPLALIHAPKTQSGIKEHSFCTCLKDGSLYLGKWNNDENLLTMKKGSNLKTVEHPESSRCVGVYQEDDGLNVIAADSLSDCLLLRKRHIQQSEQSVFKVCVNKPLEVSADDRIDGWPYTFCHLLGTFHPLKLMVNINRIASHMERDGFYLIVEGGLYYWAEWEENDVGLVFTKSDVIRQVDVPETSRSVRIHRKSEKDVDIAVDKMADCMALREEHIKQHVALSIHVGSVKCVMDAIEGAIFHELAKLILDDDDDNDDDDEEENDSDDDNDADGENDNEDDEDDSDDDGGLASLLNLTDGWLQSVKHVLETFHPPTVHFTVITPESDVNKERFFLYLQDGSFYSCQWSEDGTELDVTRSSKVKTVQVPNTTRSVRLSADIDGELAIVTEELQDCMVLQSEHMKHHEQCKLTIHVGRTLDQGKEEISITSITEESFQMLSHLLEMFHPPEIQINAISISSDLKEDKPFLSKRDGTLYKCDYEESGTRLFIRSMNNVQRVQVPETSRLIKVCFASDSSIVIVADKPSDIMFLKKEHIENHEQCTLELHVNQVLTEKGDDTSTRGFTDRWLEIFTHLLETFHPQSLLCNVLSHESSIGDSEYHILLPDGAVYWCAWNGDAGKGFQLSRMSNVRRIEVPQTSRYLGIYEKVDEESEDDDETEMVIVADQLSDCMVLQREDFIEQGQCNLEVHLNRCLKHSADGIPQEGQVDLCQPVLHYLLEILRPPSLSVYILKGESGIQESPFHTLLDDGTVYRCAWKDEAGKCLQLSRISNTRRMKIPYTSRRLSIYRTGDEGAEEVVIVADQLSDCMALQSEDIRQHEQSKFSLYISHVLKQDADGTSRQGQMELWKPLIHYLLQTFSPPSLCVHTSKDASGIEDKPFHVVMADGRRVYCCHWVAKNTCLKLERFDSVRMVPIPNTSRHVRIYQKNDQLTRLLLTQLSDCMVLQRQHIPGSYQYLGLHFNTLPLIEDEETTRLKEDVSWQDAIQHVLDTYHPYGLRIQQPRVKLEIKKCFAMVSDDSSFYLSNCHEKDDDVLVIDRKEGVQTVKVPDTPRCVGILQKNDGTVSIVANQLTDCMTLRRKHIRMADALSLRVELRLVLAGHEAATSHTKLEWEQTIQHVLVTFYPVSLDILVPTGKPPPMPTFQTRTEDGNVYQGTWNDEKSTFIISRHFADEPHEVNPTDWDTHTQAEQEEKVEEWPQCSRFCLMKREAADTFSHEQGGTLRIPGSDVILRIPPQAVPKGQLYTVYGAVHLDLKQFNPLMPSDRVHIVGPVPEYTVEGGQTFDRPVQIEIPHCVRAEKTGNIRVLCGTGDTYEVLQIDGPDMSYSVHSNHVSIRTRHFCRFIVTRSGKEEEITDAMLTVAASNKITAAKNVIQVRLMLHSGCAVLHDFKSVRCQYYDEDMVEVITTKVLLPETDEDPIALPMIYIGLIVETCCDAVIRHKNENKKETQVKVHGRNVLRLPKNGSPSRSEKLAQFILDSEKHQQLMCDIEVRFEYQEEDVDDVVDVLAIVYPRDDLCISSQTREKVEKISTVSCQTECMAMQIPKTSGPPYVSGVSPQTWMPGQQQDTPPITTRTEPEEELLQKCKAQKELTKKDIRELIDTRRPIIFQSLKWSHMLKAELVQEKVLSPCDLDRILVEGYTDHQRLDVFLDCLQAKDIKAFLDFCVVLDKDTIQQSHIVTNAEFMGLNMDNIVKQRDRLRASTQEQPSPSTTSNSGSCVATVPTALASQAAILQPPAQKSSFKARSETPPQTGRKKQRHRKKTKW